MNVSALQQARYAYQPKLPPAIGANAATIGVTLGAATESVADQDGVRERFPQTYGAPIVRLGEGDPPEAKPLTVGVILSGGQAPGGHNVVSGLFDAIKAIHRDGRLIGFRGGPGGLVTGDSFAIEADLIDRYRNTGGFDMIGSGRTKIETREQFAQARRTALEHGLAAIVVIGGDDSNTNAALLAEFFSAQGDDIKVIGVPKTIDGDLKNEYIEASFGFDTATKTFSELIGNIARDANSAKKYWHFIRLMGRSASHIALECALRTQPTLCIISEEVRRRGQTLQQLVQEISAVVTARAAAGENFGVVLIPEGLIEFIPEVGKLIEELNVLLAENTRHFATLHTFEDQSEWVNRSLSRDSSYVFSSLPNAIQRQLLMDRDPHGNVQVSRIETEALLVEMVHDRLSLDASQGTFSGTFNAQTHFFGYEGRCAFPSNFDADYCYSLGYGAALLINNGLTGYLSNVRNLDKPVDRWVAGGVPLTMLMNMEVRHGKPKPVIRKALVELDGAPFKSFAAARDRWAETTSFLVPGAIQYYGPDEVCNLPTITLSLERG